MVIALFLAALSLCVLTIVDPFGTVSYSRRALGGLVLGPVAIWYAFRGWTKGSFPELSRSQRDESSFQFWFCFVTFAAVGWLLTIFGLIALMDGLE